MQKETHDPIAGQDSHAFDEELRDMLIAISVVAKRLARTIEQEHMSKEGDGQNESEEKGI